MLPAPSSTGVDTVAGVPVGVVVQFALSAVPLKSTECTVAFRLKMIVSVLLVRSSSAAAAQAMFWVAVTAFVTLAGVALVLSVSAPFTQLEPPVVSLTCLRLPRFALKVPVCPCCAKPATTQLLLSCVVTLTVRAVPLPESVTTQDNNNWVEAGFRSEEHTSELQSRGHLVCRLLLEKKKRANRTIQLTCL